MANKLGNFFSYHTEKIGFFQNCYNINRISITGLDIVIHYNSARGFSASTLNKPAKTLLDHRDQFNRIDKLKIDACNLSQDLLEIIALMDIDEQTKAKILDQFKHKICQYLGVQS